MGMLRADWRRDIDHDEQACQTLAAELQPAVADGRIAYRFTHWSLNSATVELVYTRDPGEGPKVHEFTGRNKVDALRAMRAYLYGVIGEKCRHRGSVVRQSDGAARCSGCGTTWPSVGCYQATQIDPRQAMAESNAAFYESLETAGRGHVAIRERIAGAVAEGREQGSVECECGSRVYYSTPNRYGVRRTRCMGSGCIDGAVRPPEVVQ